MSGKMVYHICPLSLWKQALEDGHYLGTTTDQTDGFIHMSTALQAERSLLKFFQGQKNLVILSIPLAKIADKIKWEGKSDLYPHYYGVLSVKEVAQVTELQTTQEGTFILPAELAKVA